MNFLRDVTPLSRIMICGVMLSSLMVMISLFVGTDSPIIRSICIVLLFALGILALLPMYGNSRWFIRMVAFFRRDLVPVELIDMDLTVRNTLASEIDGILIAPVYWTTKIGRCVLDPRGIVDASSTSCYVIFWVPLRTEDRVAHLLRNDLPNFQELGRMKRSERIKHMIDFREQLA